MSSKDVKVLFLTLEKFKEFVRSTNGIVIKNGKPIDISKLDIKEDVYIVESEDSLFVVKVEKQ